MPPRLRRVSLAGRAAAGPGPAVAGTAARQILPGRAIAAGRLGFAVRDR